MSTNIPSAPVRLVRKQKQLLDVRYVLSTQLPAESPRSPAIASTSTTGKTAERCAATLRANKCVICVLYISQIFIVSSNNLSERFRKKNLPN